MEVLHACCAGLDVHKDLIVACRRRATGKEVHRELAKFGTTTAELLRLSEWLSETGTTHVMMESTGVFWKPVWNVLYGEFELLLANPAHVKNVPGRKSDMKDAEWLSELLAHGLVRPSFVPDPPIQSLRELTRTLRKLVRERVGHVQRIQKTLQSCNIRLDSVLSEIHGKSGMQIVKAIIAGETDPAKLARMVHFKVKATQQELKAALTGRVSDAARKVLRVHVNMIEAADLNIKELERDIDEALAPFADAVAALESIPGVGRTTASVVIAEIGADMTRFPTPGHLVSWAGLCPELNESAGRKRSNKLRKGDPWLKTALCQAAWSSIRCKKQSYLHALYHRIRSRRGAQKAIMAVAASILTSIHAMLTNRVAYHELGHNYHLQMNEQRSVARLTRKLASLGYTVELHRAA
jgi:transposase